MLNCVSIDQLDLEGIEMSYPQRRAPLSTRLSIDIEDSLASSFAFLSPKATSIAHSKSFVSAFDQSLYTKFKSKIIEDKLTSNKKLHLQLKDQDDVIYNLREQIQNKSVMSFQSIDPGDSSSTHKTLNKLIKIEKNFLERNKGKQKKEERFRIEKRVLKSQNKQNMDCVKQIQFTKQEQDSLRSLPSQLQSKIKRLKDYQKATVPKLRQTQDVAERLQTNNRLYSKQIKQLNQRILLLQTEITDLLSKNQTLIQQNHQLANNTEKLIEQQRFKCLYQLDCEYIKQEQQMKKLGV